MTPTATSPRVIAADGHFASKGSGDTVFRGTPQPVTIRAYPDLADEVDAMHRDGFVIFPDLLSPAEVAELRAFIDATGGDDASYEVKDWCYNKQIGSRYHQMPQILKYIDLPRALELAEAIHGPDCRVIGGSMWVTGPGRQMGIHLDYQPIALPADVIADPRVTVPIFISTLHIYLDDLDLSYGPTIVVPGSHRAGRPPKGESSWDGIEPQAVVVSAGDAMMFRSDIWHGAHMHSGTRRRYMLQVHYANVFIERGYPSIQHAALWTPEALAAATPGQRRLLGDRGRGDRGSYVREARVLPPRGAKRG